MNIPDIIYALRAIGVKGILRTISDNLCRDLSNRKQGRKTRDITSITPGRMLQMVAIRGGVKVEFEHASVEMLFISPHTARISWEPGSPPSPFMTSSADWQAQSPQMTQRNDAIELVHSNYRLALDSSGRISVENAEHKVIYQAKPPVRQGKQWTNSSQLLPEERIYGLGERAANLNLRPGNYICWNTDKTGKYSTGDDPLYIGSPVYLSLSSSGSSLVVFENSFRSNFRIEDELQATFEGGMLRYYLILGSLEVIYGQLAQLTGHAPLPPRWVFGYHQSRWGYRSADEIKKIVAGFKNHDLPLSVVHLDIDYMHGFRLFTSDPRRFPSLKTLAEELDRDNIKLVATVNPAVKKDEKYSFYQSGLIHDMYCKQPDGTNFTGISWPGQSVFPDFSKSSVREWWGNSYQKLIDLGISGFWHDMNEPTTFSAWGESTFPLSLEHDIDGHKASHLEMHNIYGYLMNMAAYQALQKMRPDKRPWIFSRSGWIGMQKYSWTWTGDVATSWESLQQTIPTILGLGISGQAYSGVDIGGFNGNPDAEMYTRWFQLGTFLPLFRTHSAVGTKQREPWSFGSPTTEIIRHFMELRYQLIPYLYTLAFQTSQTGSPFLRPLFWDAQELQDLWEAQDEFMLGDAFLIAPVLTEHKNSREVLFPPGEWYSFWSDEYLSNPTRVEVKAEIDVIPIFIRAGSIIPMEKKGELSLEIYPLDKGTADSMLYSDSGDGYGEWRIDRFHCEFQTGVITINWSKEGNYKLPYGKTTIVLHGGNLMLAVQDGKLIDVLNNSAVLTSGSTIKLFYS